MPEILYEDRELAVCVKPAGVPSQPDPTGDESLLLQLQNHYHDRGENEQVFPVHRLDRGTGGLIVIARTQQAAAALSAAVSKHGMEKEYLAVVHGIPDPTEGEMRDLLYWDRNRRKSYPVNRKRNGVKEASLSYQTVDTAADCSLQHIRLFTGRTHQVRVQFASRGMPLYGDGKYGAKDNARLCLWACGLSVPHPKQKKVLRFSSLPPYAAGWNLFPETDYRKT